MLSCRDVSEGASHFIEGETTLMERFNLRLHLIICSHCRRFLKQFRLTTSASRQLQQVPEMNEETAASQATVLKSKLEDQS